MIDWNKLQPLYERKAYRIVIKHIKAILQNIPFQNTTFQTLAFTIQANITENQIKDMLLEVYSTIGINYGNRINKEIEKASKAAHALFNEYLLNEILIYLSNEGGKKIVSVHNTLIEELIKAIMAELGENATVIELQNAIYKVVNNPAKFYKWQALRIARTETTFASGFAAFKTAEQSNLVMVKTWISAQDDRTRRKPFDHLEMNGKKADLYEPFLVSSDEMMYPGDPNGKPADVINCRCTIGFKAKRDMNGELIFKS